MSDFGSAVKKFDASGKNWVIFQCHFIIAMKQKRVYGHFNGSSMKPPDSMPLTQASWQEKEDTVMYLLSQKLADSTLTKYMQKDTVTQIWAAIIQGFMLEHAFQVHGYAVYHWCNPPYRAGPCTH
jgi:uncharacterized membrane protein YpjA